MNRQIALAFARRHGLTAGYLALALAFVAWIAGESFTLHDATYSTRSDYWEHAAVMHALIASPLHPQNPHLASPASSPRFGPQMLLGALWARAFHGDALFGMSLVTTLNATLLVLGIYFFFSSYFRDRWAPIYGLLVMLTAWWDGWIFSNVYQLHVLDSVEGYPSATALGLSLLAFALTLRVLRSSGLPKLALCALTVLWAMIVIVHPLTAVLALGGMGLLTISVTEAKMPGRIAMYGVLVLGLILAQLWPYFSVWQTVIGGGGQELAEAHPGHHLHEFYDWLGIAKALGLALVTVLFLPYFLVRRERWFVSLGALGLLVPFAVNMYRPLPLGHRFILLAIFFLHVGLVWLLLLVTPGSARALSLLSRRWLAWIARAGVATVLLVFLVHNLRLTKAECIDDPALGPGKQSPYVALARGVAHATGDHAVVLTESVTGWPIPAFGPKVVSIYHGNPLVLDSAAREAAVRRFFHANISEVERTSILERYQVTHVLTRYTAHGALGQFLTRRNAVRIEVQGYSLYALPRAAQ